ncbi:MAG: hypothetical protein JRI62_09740 [Deltaproteobacteria bacterium]|nr:hypothetical protein [Deltaproteobacteria bacterium]
MPKVLMNWKKMTAVQIPLLPAPVKLIDKANGGMNYYEPESEPKAER